MLLQMKFKFAIRSRHYERQAHTLSHAGPALSGIIGDATIIFFASMSSLPVDCRFGTYRAKLRSRVDGFVSEFDHNSKSAPAASNCKLKTVCVNFKFPLKEKKVLVDQTTRLCFDRTAVWY